MQFRIWHLLVVCASVALLLAIAVPFVRWAYAPTDDDHNFGIGTEYKLVSFRIQSDKSVFELSRNEMNGLGRAWQFSRFSKEIDITNHLYRDGTRLQYFAELDDGFRMNWDIHAGFEANNCYVSIGLLGGTGSTADAYSILVRLDEFLGPSRYDEFLDWAGIATPNDAG
jgi:hypothetical protein